MEPLTDLEREILTFEHQWWKYPGVKLSAIRETFDLSGNRYYQILNALIDNPAAEAHDPLVVHQLRRRREQHRHRPMRDRLRRGQSA